MVGRAAIVPDRFAHNSQRGRTAPLSQHGRHCLERWLIRDAPFIPSKGQSIVSLSYTARNKDPISTLDGDLISLLNSHSNRSISISDQVKEAIPETVELFLFNACGSIGLLILL